ncbi:MAG TPA: hypothetical protein VN493_15495 [Thermoanaerobaculia bacterium]|nr:hypothetical protein [Thermoanaerobaculia bacterium]
MLNTSARRHPFLISLALLGLSLPLAAQRVPGEWRHLGPDGGSIVSLVSAPSSPQTLYASVDGTVYRSEDGGASWTSAPLGDTLSPVYSLAVDAVNPSTLYAAQGEVVRSLDGGRTWVRVGPFFGVYDVEAHPRIAGTLFAATTGGLYQSSDGGASWKPIRRNGLPETYRAILVAVNPTVPSELYVAFEDYATGAYRLFRSLDGGASWRPADAGPLQGQRVLAVATDPRSSRLLYAGTFEGFYRSREGGESWEKIGPPGTGPQGSSETVYLMVDAARGYLYAGTYRGLFRYHEAEDAWTRLFGLPEFSLVTAILPLAPDNLLVGAYAWARRGGVFRSSDFGTSWSLTSQGWAPAPKSARTSWPSIPGCPRPSTRPPEGSSTSPPTAGRRGRGSATRSRTSRSTRWKWRLPAFSTRRSGTGTSTRSGKAALSGTRWETPAAGRSRSSPSTRTTRAGSTRAPCTRAC